MTGGDAVREFDKGSPADVQGEHLHYDLIPEGLWKAWEDAKETERGAIEVEEVPNEFVLSFETDGSMAPRVAFEKAVAELSSRIEGIEEDLALVL